LKVEVLKVKVPVLCLCLALASLNQNAPLKVATGHIAACGPEVTALPCCLHRKVAKAYFSLLEVLCHNHTGTVACQDSSTFSFVLTSLDQVGI
jgi:hypothetical protein